MNTCTTPIKHSDFTARIPKHSGVIYELLSAVRKRLSTHVQRLQEYRQHRINRLAFRTVLNLDDHMLHDIGLTRHDVHWANQLPIAENAAKILNEMQEEQRKQKSKR